MPKLPPALMLVGLLAACASAPATEPAAGQPVTEAERQRADEQKALLERQKKSLMLTLDKALDKYAQSLATSEFDRAEKLANSLEVLLRKQVSENFDQVLGNAVDAAPEKRRYRAIALGALGFSPENGRPRALEAMLNGARDPDPEIVNNAIFGLAILHDPQTPPGVIAAVIENDEFKPAARRGAAWALLRIQDAIIDPAPILPIWLRQIDRYQTADEGILLQALRGIGRSRDKALADRVLPLLKHPTPMVRTGVAIALGYLKKRDTWEPLLALIDTSETNPNVRLTARKALQELAGGVDRGYNVGQWRKVFELGQDR